ncbi:MAG: ATP-binding cassette domain-containing protein [Desulfobacteraceae bacterium]|jgi:ABC-2 type transport system ATP-binding protein
MNGECSIQPVVDVSGFKKSYGRTVAVNGAALTIMPGEIYGLIGPDGAGKSTLMKAVAGVLSYDDGVVSVFGTPVVSEKTAEIIKPRIGFMPQGLGLNLYPELSVEENIRFFARLRLVPENILADRRENLLQLTRLDSFKARPMKNLSGGMKQKLGLICSLIHEPDLIILDEPTTGVDPVSRRDFWAILARLIRERGMTALVSTAYMEEASRFHRVSLMHEGQILAGGEPESVTAFAPGIMASIVAEPAVKALTLLKDRFGQVEALGSRLRVFLKGETVKSAGSVLKNVLNGVTIHEMETGEPELEDVFLQLIATDDAPARSDHEAISAKPETATSKPETAIEASGLGRCFAEFKAVDNVSFKVPYGEIFGLLGANGAGKTTVIKMLTGILRPTEGEGQVAGADMRNAGKAIKERIGYMSQAFSLYTDLTVLENIRLYAGIYGLDRRTAGERTAWVVDMAGLEDYQRNLAGGLPMGLRQRLALGCALVHRPQVLFLDEPTSGVDPLGRRQLWETFYRLSREERTAILITTHYMSEAEHCDHLALMFAGRVVADSTPRRMKEALEADAGGLLEVSSDNALLAMELLEKNGFSGAALYGKKIHVLSKDRAGSERQIEAILKAGGVTMTGSCEKPLSMEDVFVSRVLGLEKGECNRQRRYQP